MNNKKLMDYVDANCKTLMTSCILCGSKLKVLDNRSFKCEECNFIGNIYDFVKKKYDLNDFESQLKAILKEFNLDYEKQEEQESDKLEEQESDKLEEQESDKLEEQESDKLFNDEIELDIAQEDLNNYFEVCHQSLLNSNEALDYLTKERGINLDIIEKYKIGFDAKYDDNRRIILPTSSFSCTARSIDSNEQSKKARKKGHATPFGFTNCLFEANPKIIFVCEGEMDCLSILSLNYNAVSTSSTSGIDGLVEKITRCIKLKLISKDCIFITCLDADKAGVEANKKLDSKLKEKNIKTLMYSNLNLIYKDINEAFVNDKDKLEEEIRKSINLAYSLSDNVDEYLNCFKMKCNNNKKEKILTGFEKLDKRLDGLQSGLNVIVSSTGAGKTTLCTQIVDNIAKQNNKVIYFSYEMTKDELIAKTIVREEVLDKLNDDTIENINMQFTNNKFTNKKIRNGECNSLVEHSIENYYKSFSKNINIVECNRKSNTKFIREYIEDYICKCNDKPIIFIDYLQIIPFDNSNTKQGIDDVTTDLTCTARDLDVCIVAIASINRTNYNSRIDLGAIKESGLIDYASTTVFAIEYSKVVNEILSEEKVDATKKKEKLKTLEIMEKEKIPRDLKLTNLKNRFGESGFSIDYLYYPNLEIFIEKRR